MSDKRDQETVMGYVATNMHGSECEFGICPRAEWEAMTEEQRTAALVEAARESGMFEIYTKAKP